MTQIPIGAHIGADNPIAEAKSLEIPIIQLFLGSPQSWKAPVIPHEDGASGLQTQAQEAGIGMYVHARYVINVATSNNKVRIPSRKMLQADVDAAFSIGARALIVHGGHVTEDDDPSVGVENWVKAITQLDMKVPVLIENTAGGQHAMARHLENITRLWDAVGGLGVGFCLDTCHAFAGGIPMENLTQTILGITGRIDLIHCNDSKGGFDSGIDRHANVGQGQIELGQMYDCLASAKAPIILETPGDGIVQDIAMLQEALNGNKHR